VSPDESGSCDRQEAVERDVEADWKQAQSIDVHQGAALADLGSFNPQFLAAIKEQQAVSVWYCHELSHRYVWPRWLWYFRKAHV
jgi:acetylornithine/succinyldiaminopimelate/putrescine aminotransferase